MLGRMAGDAWLKHHHSGATEETEKEWRHREARACIRKLIGGEGLTISEAPKEFFDALYAHFLALQGQSGKAFEVHMGPGNEERQWRFKIAAAAKALGLPADYGRTLRPEQLKGLLITLEKRVRAQQTIDA